MFPGNVFRVNPNALRHSDEKVVFPPKSDEEGVGVGVVAGGGVGERRKNKKVKRSYYTTRRVLTRKKCRAEPRRRRYSPAAIDHEMWLMSRAV